ncbi:MAG: CrcB family protein [Promicromonosporaceae bacterium]|nr:CrcB family protein [Promicromonosporaceae bacterium]
MTPPRPAPHRDWRLLGPVALGGAAGSVLRYLFSFLNSKDPAGWPVGTLAVNVIGAFALGLLLEAIARRGPEDRRLQRLRLTVGTGVLGGFTTYSSFALEVERHLSVGAVGVTLGYVGLTLVVGTAAAIAGVLLGARLPGRGVASR